MLGTILWLFSTQHPCQAWHLLSACTVLKQHHSASLKLLGLIHKGPPSWWGRPRSCGEVSALGWEFSFRRFCTECGDSLTTAERPPRVWKPLGNQAHSVQLEDPIPTKATTPVRMPRKVPSDRGNSFLTLQASLDLPSPTAMNSPSMPTHKTKTHPHIHPPTPPPHGNCPANSRQSRFAGGVPIHPVHCVLIAGDLWCCL